MLSQPRALLCRRTAIGFVSAIKPAATRTLGIDDPAPSLEPDSGSAAAAAATAAEAEDSAAANAELSPERGPPRGAECAAGAAAQLAGAAGERVAAAGSCEPALAEESGVSSAVDATADPFFADEPPPRWELAAEPLLALLPRPFLPYAQARSPLNSRNPHPVQHAGMTNITRTRCKTNASHVRATVWGGNGGGISSGHDRERDRVSRRGCLVGTCLPTRLWRGAGDLASGGDVPAQSKDQEQSRSLSEVHTTE